MSRWLFALALVLLIAAVAAAVVLYRDGHEQRLAVEQARSEQADQRQKHDQIVAELKKAAADANKGRAGLIGNLKRDLAGVRAKDFPSLTEEGGSESWVYPSALPRFTRGKVAFDLYAGRPIQGKFHHDAPNLYASDDDFFKVVDWYRQRIEAFLKKTGNKVPKPPAWPAKPFTPGTTGSYSSAHPKPEPLGLYVYLVMRDDKGDELRTATAGMRAGASGITAFIAGPTAKGRTIITLVRDAIEVRLDPKLSGETP